MLNIFADTFRNATRMNTREQSTGASHWKPATRFDNRPDAEIEAHLTARRRD